MSNKSLEEMMMRAINGLKDLKYEQEEKLYQKHWAEISVPFTLQEGLNRFPKYDLDFIRKRLDVKRASNLKKADLIMVLQDSIMNHVKNIHRLWDSERFEILTKIASNGGQMKASTIDDGQVTYFRTQGLIFSGKIDGEKVLTIPTELIEPIMELNNDVNVRAKINRNTEWIKLTNGLLYYYGTLKKSQLIQMIEKYTEETIDEMEYFSVLYDANTYHEFFYKDENGFSNKRVFDPKRVIQEQQSRSSLAYYPFTKQQLLTAGAHDYVEKNDSYKQLVSFLTQNYEINELDAESLVEECVYATRIGQGPNEVMQFLSYQFEFNNAATVQALMDHVVQLMNNTREWFLKGYMSTELREKETKHLQPLSTAQSNRNLNEPTKAVKIGRNEPCPCGSGKKYKKCCGK
ncbi:YecA family protein [Aquibacillus sediminis]|uniref:YecA family protein n=1 Tax=Aquibacillus sediminis TaxID=2574734 RepID=UPI001109E135|nr:SEC-C metal-binding domain-containing protein [Aquibacillus sediminis]